MTFAKMRARTGKPPGSVKCPRLVRAGTITTSRPRGKGKEKLAGPVSERGRPVGTLTFTWWGTASSGTLRGARGMNADPTLLSPSKSCLRCPLADSARATAQGKPLTWFSLVGPWSTGQGGEGWNVDLDGQRPLFQRLL